MCDAAAFGVASTAATKEMRPRVLYFAVFVFFSLSGGRFTATFLEHELQFTENWMISAAIASQLLSSSFCASWIGGVADAWAAKDGRSNGRLQIISLGLLLSTVATLLHSLGSLFVPRSGDEHAESQPTLPLPLLAYHLVLRMMFSVGTAGCMPALDGLTLAQLERDGVDKQNYGKERMYGAVSWGIAHIIFGVAIDFFGFKVLYGTVVLAFVGCMVTFRLYARSHSTNQYSGVEMAVAPSSGDRLTSGSDEAAPRAERYKSKTSFEGEQEFENDTTSDGTPQERLRFADLVGLLFQHAPVLNASFLVALFTLFIGMAVVESLIFLYFEYLGGSSLMEGITVVVTVLFELPLFHFAPDVLRLLGATTMFQLGCLAYVVRVIGYSLVPTDNPYLVLFLEPLHGVTIAFAMTSSVAFADEWVPSGYESSGQAFISMVRGLGQFVGLCIGGALEGRVLYRVLAAIVTVGSLILGVGSRMGHSRIRSQRLSKEEECEEEKKEEESPTISNEPQGQDLGII